MIIENKIRKDEGEMRAFSSLVKLRRSNKFTWAEIAKVIYKFEKERWNNICENANLIPTWFEIGEGEHKIVDDFACIKSMYHIDRPGFSTMVLNVFSQRTDWVEIVKNHDKELLDSDMEIQVNFKGTLRDLSIVYSERTGINTWEAQKIVMDYFLIFGALQLNESLVRMKEVIYSDKEPHKETEV